MERALKILNAVVFAYLGALGLLLYLHTRLNPSVPEVELLYSWASWGCMPLMFAPAFLPSKDPDHRRLRFSPAVIRVIAVIASLIGIVAAISYGMGLTLPRNLMPLMVVPYGLGVAVFMGWYAIRMADLARDEEWKKREEREGRMKL